MSNQTAISRAIDNSLNAELGILKAAGKAVDLHKLAARVLFDELQPQHADDAVELFADARKAARQRLEKKLKNAQVNKAFSNALDQIRVFFLILAEPDHGVILTAGGSAVRAEETTNNIANARKAAKAIVDGDDGSKNARPARTPTGPKIDTVAASAQAFEGDMIKARETFEAILGMQSGWGMVIDVLRSHGFVVTKAEAKAEAPKAEAPKAEAPKAEAPKAKAKAKAKAEARAS